MRWKPDKNQITWGLIAFCTVLALMLCYLFIFHGSAFISGFRSIIHSLSSILLGVVIALLLSPFVDVLEQKWLIPFYLSKGIDVERADNYKKRKTIRKISLLISESVFLLVFVVLMLIIIPQTVNSIREISTNFSAILGNANESLNESLELTRSGNHDFYLQLSDDAKAVIRDYSDKVTTWINSYVNKTILPNASNVIREISNQIANIIKGFFNLIIGFIVSIYILYSKERMLGQFKKVAYAVFNEHEANVIVDQCRFIAKTFVRFLSGKLLDSLIIGILCFIGTRIIGTPYALLVSVLVGMTNIIPFFGPYIGAIVGSILIVLINPWQALYFLIFVLILQQFDGNILGPKILGDSTGISSFWVIVAIMLFGGMFGVVGWIIGVPMMAVIFGWIRRFTFRRLSSRKLPTQSADYEDVYAVQNGQIIHNSDVHSNKESRMGKTPGKKFEKK